MWSRVTKYNHALCADFTKYSRPRKQYCFRSAHSVFVSQITKYICSLRSKSTKYSRILRILYTFRYFSAYTSKLTGRSYEMGLVPFLTHLTRLTTSFWLHHRPQQNSLLANTKDVSTYVLTFFVLPVVTSRRIETYSFSTCCRYIISQSS